MKKILVSLAVVLCSAAMVSAQDLETVTTTYNNAAAAIAENKTEAIKLFEEALSGAEALGEDGAAIVDQCKEILPKLYVSVAKEAVAAKDFTTAISKFKVAEDIAEQYGDEEAKAEVAEIMPKIFIQLGASQLKEGNMDAAIETFEEALELGQTDVASKQLSNIYVKKAAAAQKAKDLKGAMEMAQRSIEYLDNATAQKLLGLSALSLKQNKVAADALKAYLALSPEAKDKVQIMYQLGTALVAAGENGEACGYFKQIAQDAKWGEAARYQITTLKCN